MEEYLLCSNCAKDKNLIHFIDNRGIPGRCCLCTLPRTRVVPAYEAANLFKALIRYHYSESEYNEHWGGNYPPKLLRSENPIIKTDNIDRAEAANPDFSFDSLIEDLTSPDWPNESVPEKDGIWIFAGFDPEGGRDLYPQSLRDRRDPRVADLGEELAHTNYHALEDRWKRTLAGLLHYAAENITVGAEYYRARIGVAGEFERYDYESESEYVVQPYTDSQLAAPPQSKATSGRLNRVNISYLYVADNSRTALSEIRPHPGHVVSIGKFTVARPLRVAGLANVILLPFATNELGLDQFVLLKTIEHAFATPVTPDNAVGYLATQFLADIIRQLGYDGVTYRSSLGTGVNVTVFDPAALTYVPNSAIARKVTCVLYEYDKVTVDMERDPDSLYTPLKRTT